MPLNSAPKRDGDSPTSAATSARRRPSCNSRNAVVLRSRCIRARISFVSLVVIWRSQTDQTGEGQEVAIPRGYRLRPVEAVQTWLAAAEISVGPVFRAVALGGRRVSDAALADDSASRIVKRYARRVAWR